MSFNFVIPQFNINGAGTPPLQFFRRGFILNDTGGSQPSWKDIILHGVTALTLVNSKADGLNYLKLFGDTEQLPETYIDSVTLDGKCEQKNLNLPVGYTQLEYVETSGTQYIDTGIKINQKDSVEVDYCYYMTSSNLTSGRVFGARYTSAPRNSFAVGTNTGRIETTTTTFGQRGDTSFTGQSLVINSWFNIKMNPTGFYIDDVSYGSFPITNFETPYTLKLFAFEQSASGATPTIACGIGRCKSFKIYREDVLIQNLIPCKNSSNEVGFYDTVSDTFLTNAGTGNFVAGATVPPTPDIPQDIVCNNGTIKYSANMANVNAQTALVGYYITTNGVVTADTYNWMYQDFIPVKPNTTYTLTMSSSVYYVSISEYSTADDSGFVIRKAGSTGSNTTLTITTGSTTNYIRFGTNLNRTAVTLDKVLAINWMLNVGNTMAYQPYVKGGIYTDGTVETATDNVGNVATAEMLLSLGTYKDTQEVLTGAVTRNVGIKVLDGTEDWNDVATGGIYRYACTLTNPPYIASGIPRGNFVATHFVYISSGQTAGGGFTYKTLTDGYKLYLIPEQTLDTVAKFKQFLTDQYNAGTPVIIVYPTSSSTTETVTPQFLSKEPVTVTGSLTGLVANVVSSSHTTPTPTQPLPINTNNGVVKVSKNLFNKNSYTEINAYVNSNTGVLTQGSPGESTQYCAVIPCLPNTTYTISGRANSAWGAFTSRNIGTTATSFNKTENGSITTGANDKYLIGLVRANQNVIDYRNTLQVELGSTATPYMPYGQIYTDGTVETVGITGKNLYNPNSPLLKTQAPNISGTPEYPNTTPTQYPNAITYFMTVQPNTAYTYSCSTKGDRFGVWGINSIINPDDYTTSNRLRFDSVIIAGHSSNIQTVYNFTTGASTKMIAVYCALSTRPTNIQIEQGSTATDYEPYFNGGSATAEMLLKVDNYQDVQSVIDGHITRNVGIKVLDGTENWTRNSGSSAPFALVVNDFVSFGLAGKVIVYSSHFQGVPATATWSNYENLISFTTGTSSENRTFRVRYLSNTKTLAEFKQFLAEQYANGTPVICVYYKTPTTETVTGQPLTIQAGTNVVEITQASMDNLELEVSYKAGVSVTVTEIENAQLDNSVEVTVNG